ncbi:MAG: hypothetical protein ABIQ39_08515, partial [Ilumatobacteraceae bacterium]
MPDINLFPSEPAGSHAGWEVVEAARHYRLTCELELDTTPPARIYMRNGEVYFAERTTDGGLAVRLLSEGLLRREQIQRGTIVVGGVEHLGQLFERDPSVDRGPVELCVEMFTDEVLTAIATDTIDSYRVRMYRRHPSGVDRWNPALRRNSDVNHGSPSHQPADVDRSPESAVAAGTSSTAQAVATHAVAAQAVAVQAVAKRTAAAEHVDDVDPVLIAQALVTASHPVFAPTPIANPQPSAPPSAITGPHPIARAQPAPVQTGPVQATPVPSAPSQAAPSQAAPAQATAAQATAAQITAAQAVPGRAAGSAMAHTEPTLPIPTMPVYSEPGPIVR